MQSAAVYSCSRTAARSLASNLTNECNSKCTSTTVALVKNSSAASSLLSNRLLNRLYTNIRHLSQGLTILTKSSHNIHSTVHTPSSLTTSSSGSSSSIKSQTTPVTSTPNPVVSTASSPANTSLSNDPLRLVTAYSGYSKEFNFISNSTSKLAGIQLLNRKKGVIGDDAWFIASQKCADVMGVADGVGGWRDIGVDPSRFSSHLMRTCKRLVEQELGSALFSNGNNVNRKTPIEILSSSYQSLLENKSQSLIGSSTACIIVFNRESNCLHSANLGDSGFVVIRHNKIVHRSQEQTHYFNSPFQMAILPSFNSSIRLDQHEQDDFDVSSLFNDSPDLASLSSFNLCEGDFIVVATDGLWDNLSENTLLLEISKIKVS